MIRMESRLREKIRQCRYIELPVPKKVHFLSLLRGFSPVLLEKLCPVFDKAGLGEGAGSLIECVIRILLLGQENKEFRETFQFHPCSVETPFEDGEFVSTIYSVVYEMVYNKMILELPLSVITSNSIFQLHKENIRIVPIEGREAESLYSTTQMLAIPLYDTYELVSATWIISMMDPIYLENASNNDVCLDVWLLFLRRYPTIVKSLHSFFESFVRQYLAYVNCNQGVIRSILRYHIPVRVWKQAFEASSLAIGGLCFRGVEECDDAGVSIALISKLKERPLSELAATLVTLFFFLSDPHMPI